MSVYTKHESNGKLVWALQPLKPPLTLPWGYVYPPYGVETHDPDTPRDACCGRTGTYSKRVFTIVIPRTREVCVAVEPNGVFTPTGSWWRVGCAHQKERVP